MSQAVAETTPVNAETKVQAVERLSAIVPCSPVMRNYFASFVGQMITVLLARYAYRGILLGYDDVWAAMCGTLIEAGGGGAQQTAPSSEDPMVSLDNNVFLISLSALEVAMQPTWQSAPLPESVLSQLGTMPEFDADGKHVSHGAKATLSAAAYAALHNGLPTEANIIQKYGIKNDAEILLPYLQAREGKPLAVLCARYNYRGLLGPYDAQCVVLKQSTLVESSGPAGAERPQFESSNGSSSFHSLPAAELLYVPGWAKAPLPGEQGYQQGS